MRFFAIFILSFFSLYLQAQPLQKKVENYPFANFNRNKILYASDSIAFEHFFQKIDKLLLKNEGNINILHIGGSHVQAGIFTQQFRQNMQSLYPINKVASKGLIFPFSAAKTNNPPSFKTRYTGKWRSYRNTQRNHGKTLGLTGIAICTNDTNATLSISTREHNALQTKQTLFNKVTILGYSTNDSLRPIIYLNDTILKAIHNKKQQLYNFYLRDYTDSISISLNKYNGEFTLTGILLENEFPGITVHGVGVNGASLNSYFRCENFNKDLALLNPDLIIFAIGINDATSVNFNKDVFIANYEKLINKIQEQNPECAFLFITNNDSFRRYRRNYQVNRNGAIVEKAFFQIAEKCNGAVWNLFDIMGGLRSMQQWEDEGLAKRDKIHFTKKGYIILGDLLYNALVEKYLEYLEHLHTEQL